MNFSTKLKDKVREGAKYKIECTSTFDINGRHVG